MRITIRKGMFETNSSSTHVCIITKNDDEYKGFINGDLYFYKKEFIADPIIEGYKVSEIKKDYEDMKEDDFMKKYEKIFYEYPEDIDYDLYYDYDVMSYSALNMNCERFITSRDDIKVLSFVGYDF